MKNEDVFVKENYHLSRERITFFSQVASVEMELPNEFVFKGKGKPREPLIPPEGAEIQWSDSGSYKLEQMLETISHLPNRHSLFRPQDYAIYVLDNYAVHLQEEVRKALLKRGYILVLIGGGITGDIQGQILIIKCSVLFKPIFVSSHIFFLHNIFCTLASFSISTTGTFRKLNLWNTFRLNIL